MSKEFYIQVLKPVPKIFRENRPFTSKEIYEAGLIHKYNEELLDDYHVKITEHSVYASMDDIQKYLQTKLPDATFGSWGMRPYGDGVRYCYGEGWSYTLSSDEQKSLERLHAAECVVVCPENSWSFPSYSVNTWLESHCPIYLTDETLPKLLIACLEGLKQESPESLSWYLDEQASSSIFHKLCEASAYAHQVGGVAIVEWE